jgi:predicted neuraminidase
MSTNQLALRFVLALLLLKSGAPALIAQDPALADPKPLPAVITSEFIFEKAPFPSCHASTIAETTNGLVAAWFGGTAEKNPDVGIWLSRHEGKGWSTPLEVANGIQSNSTKRLPCWNPVLFQPRKGPLLLFYKVGPTPSRWWGMLTDSTDGGKTWTPPRKLPDGILGPIKNKPVELSDETLLCPSSTEDAGWRVHLERTSDLGLTWTKTAPINDGKEFGAIQPTLLVHNDMRMKMLCRSKQKKITEAWSGDGGKTWGGMKASTLPNPNSGIDAVMLKDHRALLVYNHTTTGRTPLNVAVTGNGVNWLPGPILEDEPGEYSYPAVIQARDGLVHITYTWKRERIKHVVIDPKKLIGRIVESPK